MPLAWSLTGANRNDVTQLVPLVDAVPPVRGRVGRPLSKPKAVYADRGYDHDKYRMKLSCRGVASKIARRGTPHGSGLGKVRWVVEWGLCRFHQFRRLRTRWEVRDDVHEWLMNVAGCLITWHIARRLC